MVKQSIKTNKLTKNIIISKLDKVIKINKLYKRIADNLKLEVLLNKK